MDKKIPFGVKILKKSTFLKIVEDWMADLDIELFSHQQYFKYFPRFIVNLERKFTADTIKYTILKRFPLLINEKSQEDVVLLSGEIKKAYAKINIDIIMKLDSYFYFLTIFLTKIITKFLKDLFTDIDIDKDLQSELYIIIVFVIIGLEVAPKTYQINHKKIIYQKLLKSKPKSLCKFQTVETFHQKASSNKITQIRGIKKINVERKYTNFSFKQQYIPTPLDQFKQNLKENLAVKILPKLVKKKIKGFDFDYNAQKHEAQMEGDQRKYIFLQKNDGVSLKTQQFINSNQNSTSFDHLFRENNQKGLLVHRNVKISHRPQLLLNNKNLGNQHFYTSALNTPKLQNQQNQEEKNNKNWIGIIKQIRQHAFQTNKVNSFIQNEEGTHQFQRDIKQNCDSNRFSQQNNLKPNEPQFQQRQCCLVPKLNNFGSYLVQQKQQQIKTQKQQFNPPNSMIKARGLRRQRHFFNQSCEKRFKQSYSSMFNIGNPSLMTFHL